VSTALQTEDRVFESLYRLNRPVIYAYALSRLRNPSDAEDVTQTTFLNAYTALHRGIVPRDELQWLIAIARNVCRDRYRDAKRRPVEEPLEEWTPAVQPDPPEYTVGEIAKQIAGLHPRHRQILLMREFEGRSYGEISAQLGVSQTAVQALLVRARRTLRDELELGITCTQARRISLRHLNGVAVRDERRALNRHLRKCSDCATFVGRRPRSLTGLLLLPTLPFRKLGALVFGTSSAPVGTTAGSGGAFAVKVLALTAIGSTAVGVTVKEVTSPPPPSHSPAAPTSRRAPTPVHHPSVRAQSAPVSTWTSFRAPAGRAPLTHATAHTASAPTRRPPASVPAAIVVPSAATVELPPAASPAAAAPDNAAPLDHQTEANLPESATPSPGDEAPTPAAPSSAPAAPAAETADATMADTTAAASTTTPTATTSAAAPDSPPVTTSPPPAVTPPAPADGPPTVTPATGNGNANANGNANGVGRGGTPPGQGGMKPEPRGHQ
jgi:RNA polymerase sigma-70 factor, ECF subfamily